MLTFVTVISVLVPVASIAAILAFVPNMPDGLYWGAVLIAAIIPLLIAPPISFVALNVLRLLTNTIDRLDHYVRHDALTGVLSRVCLLGQTHEQLRGGGAFLMIDADHFKSINDSHGHDIGDEALKRLAEVLRSAMPANGLVGRLGGEEFGVFLPGLTSAEAGVVAAGLCNAMRSSGKLIANREINLTVSIGVALHLSSATLEQTMKAADEALYQAKRSGRDRYHLALPGAVSQLAASACSGEFSKPLRPASHSTGAATLWPDRRSAAS